MGLLTDFSHLPRELYVLAVAKHSAKRVAGKRFGGWLVPSHDDSGIQAASERHADTLMAVKVPGQVAREHIPQLPVERLGFQRVLLLPLTRQEIGCLLVDRAVPKTPGRSAGQHVNVLENSAIFQDATARDK